MNHSENYLQRFNAKRRLYNESENQCDFEIEIETTIAWEYRFSLKTHVNIMLTYVQAFQGRYGQI